MSETQNEQKDWTVEEQTLIEKAREYFVAIAAVEQARGRTQEALFAAMPPEIAEQMPMMQALGGL